MALENEDRLKVTRGLMRLWSREWSTVAISKTELYTAVGAMDDWIEANQAAINTALPAAARTGLTLLQKTLLFCAVALARVSIAVLQRVFGEVD